MRAPQDSPSVLFTRETLVSHWASGSVWKQRMFGSSYRKPSSEYPGDFLLFHEEKLGPPSLQFRGSLDKGVMTPKKSGTQTLCFGKMS